MAVAHGLAPRQVITQVDRLLSSPQLRREEAARCGVRFVVAARRARFVNFDWTACEGSEQSMIVLGPQTEHGRSTPLVWKTVTRSERKDQRQAHADERRGLLTEVLPEGVRVTIVADRGCSDSTRDRFLQERGCDDIIRFRGVVDVESADGARRQAKGWLGASGRMRELRGPRGTAEGQPVPIVVCVQQKHACSRNR